MSPTEVGLCSLYEFTAAVLHYKRISDTNGNGPPPPPSDEFMEQYAAALEALKNEPGVKVH